MRVRPRRSWRASPRETQIDAHRPHTQASDEELRDAALLAARAAAELHREAAGTLDPATWAEKDPSDFVTEVDREAERRIVDSIRDRFPHHRILAEEGTAAETSVANLSDTDVLWIIDPLDGTTNWLHEYPEFAVSIAALDRRGLRAATVLNSARGEEFVALRGGGATLNGQPIHVSGVNELRLSLVGTGFPFKRAGLLPDYLETLGAVLQATSGVRRGGSAALDLCSVACGRLEAFWEHWLMPWDVAAGALIVTEAGGTFDGLPVEPGHALSGPSHDGCETSAVFAGTGGRLVPGPGAFVAGNGLVDPSFRTLLATVLGEPAGAERSD